MSPLAPFLWVDARIEAATQAVVNRLSLDPLVAARGCITAYIVLEGVRLALGHMSWANLFWALVWAAGSVLLTFGLWPVAALRMFIWPLRLLYAMVCAAVLGLAAYVGGSENVLFALATVPFSAYHYVVTCSKPPPPRRRAAKVNSWQLVPWLS